MGVFISQGVFYFDFYGNTLNINWAWTRQKTTKIYMVSKFGFQNFELSM